MDKDAMITYLIGELKRKSKLHGLIIPEELEEKQSFSGAFNTVNQWQHQHNF